MCWTLDLLTIAVLSALLRIHDISGSDAGKYRCRVDFAEAPSRNSWINLTVIGKAISFSLVVSSLKKQPECRLVAIQYRQMRV